MEFVIMPLKHYSALYCIQSSVTNDKCCYLLFEPPSNKTMLVDRSNNVNTFYETVYENTKLELLNSLSK